MKRQIAAGSVALALLCHGCSEPVSPAAPSQVSPGPSGLGSAAVPAEISGPLAASARGALAAPFKGSFDGTQTVTPLTPPFASVEMSGTGTATQVGRMTIALPHTVNFATSSAQGTCTIVAADGATLVADFTGQAQVGPIVSIVEQATITGGTGRFAGATGSFTIQRQFNPAAGTTSGSFEGTISSPGAVHH